MMTQNGRTQAMYWRTTKQSLAKSLPDCAGKAMLVPSTTTAAIGAGAQRSSNTGNIIILFVKLESFFEQDDWSTLYFSNGSIL